MADTFSIDPGSVVSGVQPSDGRRPQANVGQGAAVPQGVAPMQAPDTAMNVATTDALLKLGGAILAPKIKEAATQQFMEGVQAAAQGEALKDIVEQRPWYTEIFGPSSAVQGAQAYTVATQVAKFGADMEAQMPKLAQQGPEALTAALTNFQKTVMTGVPAADAAITSQIVDQMQPLYKRHAKEHYVYQQRKASDAQVDAWSTLGAGYQQRAAAATKPDGGVTPEDVKADADRLLGSMIPFADQPDEAYDKNVGRFLEASATAGNFQVVKLFKEKGLYDKLPPDTRAALDRTFRAAGRQTLDKAMPEFALDVAMLVNDTAQDPRGIADRVAKLNAKAAAVTGVTEAELIPVSSLDNIVGNVLRSQAAAGAKVADDQAAFALANSQLDVPGGVGPCKSIGACKETQVEKAALLRFNSTQDPAAKAALLNNSATETFGAVKSNMLAPFNTKEDTPGFQSLGQVYRNLNDESKGRYFDAEQRKFLDRYTRAVDGGEAPAAAFQIARVSQPLAKFYLDDKEKGEAATAIRSWVEEKNENWLGWNQIDDNSMRIAQAVVGQAVSQDRGLNSIPASVARAMSDATSTGRLQIIGKHAVLGTAGDVPLTSILGKGENNMGAKEVASIFEETLSSKAEAVGTKLTDYTIIRVPGPYARFMVEAIDKEGKVVSFNITADELRGRHGDRTKKAAAKQAAIDADTGDAASTERYMRERQADLNPVR